MRKTFLAAAALTISATAAASSAHADTIDYGTDQSSCQAAAQQANASGQASAFCYQTGPGHYSLSYNRR